MFPVLICINFAHKRVAHFYRYCSYNKKCFFDKNHKKDQKSRPEKRLVGGSTYYYTLRSYDENEVGREITFGTSRELKEGAFIRLTVMPVRGVLEWSEIQYDELPIAVEEQYILLK